ncbi:GDNF family receptor alpha-like isoform X1 [Acanthochromis polyacanthus]|uniref:GDNF family receptor alpha-like isoform X1 n=1 Tax=Acanthochromis polyacanthus TaxID=80966 RepID=UPI000B907C40|nr:GDNF family receptor alpha-like isoform X1 [Acanthochromis polyacanthus]
MQLIQLEAAFLFAIVIPQITSNSITSPVSDCLAAENTCMSDLCESEQAFYGSICEDEGCQIKGSEVCNMTIQTILDQFPSLRGCVCAWEEDLCDSIQVLASQCHRKPAVQQKRNTMIDWQSSGLLGYVYDGAGSCLDRIRVCVSDAVCNRHLAPVLQACMAEQCDSERCQRATQQFYGNMPQNVAEMLVMCECEASDQSCLQMTMGLHSGACGDETRICQETLYQCVKDRDCRDLLSTFQSKCWSSEGAQCSDSDLRRDECFSQMDPAVMLGTDSECKMTFLATLGTALHYPCTCKGVYNDKLLMCNAIHDVLHNRSRFITSWKSSRSPFKPPESNASEQRGSHDYLLYVFAIVLLVGVIVIMPLAVVSKIWMLRRRDKAKFHHPEKSSCVVIF